MDALSAGHIEPLDVLRDEAVAPGGRLTLSGYGHTEEGSHGTLLFLEETVAEVDETTIMVDGGEHHGALCAVAFARRLDRRDPICARGQSLR